jgi:RHS repeat-associated protein
LQGKHKKKLTGCGKSLILISGERHPGSVRSAVVETGMLKERYEYDAFEVIRYRWIGEGTESVKTRNLYEDGYGVAPGRFTGISVTLYGRGEAVAVSRSSSAGSRGGAAYLGKDILGSVRSTTNEYGSLEDRYEYDAFGKPYQGDLTTGMNLGYTGKPYDTATGLYNYGYRDYRPEAARFTTVDPIRDGANWFAYVNNDPVNWVDLWGLSASDPKNDKEMNKQLNTVIGIGEMVLGAALFVAGPLAAASISATAPPASSAAFSAVGQTGVLVDGGLFSIGFSRVVGGYNGSFLNDVRSAIVTPMAEAFSKTKR